jgi:hypothetical protein
MSQLAKLLGVDARRLGRTVDLLDTHSGGSVDTKLLGDIYESAARAMHALGLDPANTTGPELYHALEARFAKDFKQLIKSAKFDGKALRALMEKSDFPKFWKTTLWTGALRGDQPVSFNVFDVWENHNRKIPYAHRRYDHFQKDLAAQLLGRYEDQVKESRVLLAGLKADLAGEKK